MPSTPAARVIPIRPLAGPDDSGGLYPMGQGAAEIYPRAVHGWYARWRWFFVWATQLFFYGLPWLEWGGRQAVLFDIEAQRFFILGLVLYPQDLIYLAALLVISALALFLFTAVAGRLWCGYTCPQTVYTEIFMWVERRIEGDRIARMRLDAAGWSADKFARKAGKHSAWLAIGLYTGFSFVGYFTPIRELAVAVAGLAVPGWTSFWIAFYGLATYGNAGFLREQICKYMCPYARFQSALIDRDSLVIAYDTARGEPRGSRSRKATAAAQGLGDCIDCTLCVQVCPTGIDIREGLQNECIGCAACIDVCNGVMDKMGYAQGLIRYDTENGVAEGLGRWQLIRRALRPRVLIYGALLLIAATAFSTSVALRSPFLLDVIKDRNTLGRIDGDGAVVNVYRLQLMNRSERTQRYRFSASGPEGLRLQVPPLVVEAASIGSVTATLALPMAQAQVLKGQALPVVFEVALDASMEKGTAGVTNATRAVTTPSAALQREKSVFHVPR